MEEVSKASPILEKGVVGDLEERIGAPRRFHVERGGDLFFHLVASTNSISYLKSASSRSEGQGRYAIRILRSRASDWGQPRSTAPQKIFIAESVAASVPSKPKAL